jgi:hypothetical protein
MAANQPASRMAVASMMPFSVSSAKGDMLLLTDLEVVCCRVRSTGRRSSIRSVLLPTDVRRQEPMLLNSLFDRLAEQRGDFRKLFSVVI